VRDFDPAYDRCGSFATNSICRPSSRHIRFTPKADK
jgi:hypothetical protein